MDTNQEHRNRGSMLTKGKKKKRNKKQEDQEMHFHLQTKPNTL
jgi:hypothetical protein